MSTLKDCCHKCDRATNHRTARCGECGQNIDRYDCAQCGLGAEGPHGASCSNVFD